MAIQKLNLADALTVFNEIPVVDVRSPSEYNHAHIPGGYNLPLFSDDERKVVGTLYKQESRENAIKAGLHFFGPKMNTLIEEAKHIVETWRKSKAQYSIQNEILIHCWRGGMRSAGMAWLLDLYGFKVYTITGGYKAYRNWVLAQFERTFQFNILGGYTGSGKTKILHELEAQGQIIIDLEKIAGHKGSAFGGLDGITQPTQEMFDNILANELFDKAKLIGNEKALWLEDESQRIGLINLNSFFWKNMKEAQLYFLKVPFEERLNNILKEYGAYDKEKLSDAILRIQKRLGGLDTKNALTALHNNNMEECFRILLTYYDKHYEKALHNKENTAQIKTITFLETSLKQRAAQIISY